MRKRCRREVAEAACAVSFALTAEEKEEDQGRRVKRCRHNIKEEDMNRFWLKRTPWSRENLAERKAAEQEFEMLKSCAIVIALPFLWLLCIVVFVLWFFLVFWLIYKPESVIIR